MPGEDDIIQRISLLGAEDIRKELNQLGDDGAAALKKIEAAGGGDLAKGVRALMPEVAKFEQGISNASLSAARLPGIFGRIKNSLLGLNFGSKFATDADAATASTNNLGRSVKSFGKDIRALGRVTDLAGIGQFGRSISLVGRNIGLIAFPAAIGAMGLLAHSAASATQKFQDLAFIGAKAPIDLQKSATAALAFGGSVDKLGEALAKIPQAARETALQEKGLSDASIAIRSAIDKGSDAIERQAIVLKRAKEQIASANFSYSQFLLTIALGLDPVSGLKEQIENLDIALQKGTISQADYAKQSKKLNDQLTLAQNQQQEELKNLQLAQEHAAQGVRDANKAMSDQVKAAEEAEHAARAQKKTLEENANAYVKLGVSAGQLKNLKIEESFQLIADRLSGMNKGVIRNSLAFEIFGENARKFISALDSGAGGLKKFIAEGQRIAPAFTDVQNAIGDKLLASIDKTTAALGFLKDAFGLTIAPVFTEFFTQLVELIIQNREGIVSFGTALATILGPLLQGFLILIKGVIATFKLLSPLFELLASGINKLFGSNLTGAQVMVAVIVGLIGAFAGIVPVVILAAVAISRLVDELSKINFQPILQGAKNIWTNLSNGFNATIKFIVDAFNGGLQFIVDSWNGVIGFFQNIWDSIVTGAVGIWTTITDAFSAGVKFIKDAFFGAIQFVKDAFASFLSYIQSWVNSSIQYIQGVIDKLKQLVGAITGVNKAGQQSDAATQQSFAGGGRVSGPGTGTSDSILARVSNGEYIIKTAAVEKYGAQLFHAFNSMSMPRAPMLPGFSFGGLVEALSPIRSVPRFAEGGSVARATARSNFTLQIGAESFAGLSAPQDTADRMVKFATVRSIRRTGARPNWYGNGR